MADVAVLRSILKLLAPSVKHSSNLKGDAAISWRIRQFREPSSKHSPHSSIEVCRFAEHSWKARGQVRSIRNILKGGSAISRIQYFLGATFETFVKSERRRQSFCKTFFQTSKPRVKHSSKMASRLAASRGQSVAPFSEAFAKKASQV